MWIIIQSILWWLFIAILIFTLIILIGFYLRGAFRDRPLSGKVERLKYPVKNPPHPEAPSFALTLASITNSLITKRNKMV